MSERMTPLIPCAEVVDVCSKLIAVLTEELNLGLGEAETIAYAYEHNMRAVIDQPFHLEICKARDEAIEIKEGGLI